MNFNWNAVTIKWYQEANEYSGFFKNIADLVTPKLAGYSTFCDIGCGLGLVDLELSKSIKNITCIDINKEAIKSLKKNIEDREISNIETCLMDCNDIDGSWDVIYTSFFGSHELEKFFPFCKKLIAVVDKRNKNNPCIDKYQSFHRNSYDKVEEKLREKGIAYSLTEVSLEFGQPLISIEEAKSYIKTNYAEVNDEDLNHFLDQKLIETKEKEYPFYIPKKKSVGIFELEGDCK